MKTLIYGGTFNPPHIGHIRLALNAKELIKPDKMLLIPSLIPPHKQKEEIASSLDRYNMTLLAAEEIGCEVSDMELTRKDVSYSVLTLEELKRQGHDDIFFLMGSDMFLYLEKWYKAERILELCTVVTAPRKPDELDLLKAYAEKLKVQYKAKSIICNFTVTEISSTELRDKIKAGESSESLIPQNIADYINKNGLYKR